MIDFLGGICLGILLMAFAEFYDDRKERKEKQNVKRKTRR